MVDRVYSLVTIFSNKTTVMAEERNVRVLSPSNSELSDCDSELESQPGPSKKSAKKRKMNKSQRSLDKDLAIHRCATWRYPFIFMYCML